MAKTATNKNIPKLDNSTNATPATTTKILQIAKMLSQGKSRQTCVEYAMDKFGVSEVVAGKYYKAAAKYLVPDNLEEYRKGLIQANIERLERIVEECMEGKQYKIAREAIDSLNKMLGITGGVQVGIQTDKENNTQQVIIKFDN